MIVSNRLVTFFEYFSRLPWR